MTGSCSGHRFLEQVARWNETECLVYRGPYLWFSTWGRWRGAVCQAQMLSDLNKDSGKCLAKGITTMPKTPTHSLIMWSVRWAPVLVCVSNLPTWVWKATRSRNVLRTGCCCVFLRTKHMSTPKPLFWRVSDVVNKHTGVSCVLTFERS